ncbi:MAG TPA: class I SAM-dependent methyltransferase [Gaiellaceae bacterium]|nr:class I SAM-dependent methyltransferase [Gaiellaceae bacterium]
MRHRNETPTTPSAGEVVFDGVPIFVSPGAVMTPVLDTIALVDVAAEWIGSRSVRVADVGTGSGAVAVALALRAPAARIWATDDSQAAVSLARTNVARHDLQERVHVLFGNLLEPVPDRLDIVLANLPYHAEARSRGPDETANRDQPEHAIYAPGDGLQPNRDLIRACRTQLEEEGCLAIQLYGSVLSARRDELDQLLREIEARAAQGWEARAAADAAGAVARCEPWRATPYTGSRRSPAVRPSLVSK